MIVYKDIEQNTDEWYSIRKGIATASAFDKILTPGGQPSKQRVAYMRKLARECQVSDPAEIETQRKLNKYNFSIKWGNEYEPVAREWFREHVMPVSTVGFVACGNGVPLGCSPDGLIPNGGDSEGWYAGLEIKCPMADTHVGYIMDGILPNAYRLQVHGSMAITGLSRWYFLSYFPELKPFFIEVKRDNFTEKVNEVLGKFVAEYKVERNRILKAILPVESEVAA